VQVFEAAPKEIVAGDDTAVTLTWSVSGKTTDIQITGGGIPLTGLDPQGSLSLTISDGAIFVLTAYNGDLSSSKHVQISTTEATPVPPDAPVIVDFSAEIDINETVSIDLSTGVYKILEGADVTLKWEVKGEDVDIELNDSPAPSGEKWLGPIDADADYKLTATNETATVVDYLYIRVFRVLPPPQNFAWDPPTFSWEYLRPDDIKGFRLYKTPGEPVLVAATEGLGITDPDYILPKPDEAPYEWELPDHPDNCGTFFLVAVYDDPYDNDIEKETDAAADSWGILCP
jgi:hypothetical protein